jgi:hypothetical protein
MLIAVCSTAGGLKDLFCWQFAALLKHERSNVQLELRSRCPLMILLYAKCVHLLNRSIIAWPCVCLGCYCECILLLLLLLLEEEEEESSFVYEWSYIHLTKQLFFCCCCFEVNKWLQNWRDCSVNERKVWYLGISVSKCVGILHFYAVQSIRILIYGLHFSAYWNQLSCWQIWLYHCLVVIYVMRLKEG